MGQTGWGRRHLPGGLAWLYIGGNRRKKESLSGIQHFSLPIYESLPFPLHPFSHCIWTHSIPFSFSALLDSSYSLTVSFLSRFYRSSGRSHYFFLLYSLHSSVSPLSTFFSLVLLYVHFNHLLVTLSFQRENLGVRSVPVQSRWCHPTKRVGVKHRHRHSLPER